MPTLTVPAHAKLNLTLDVLGKRPDGYHDLRMVMQSIALADELTVTVGPGRGIAVRTDLAFLPCDRRNLAAAAAVRFLEHTGQSLAVEIDLRKKIPVCAGMGGGSSDAAAVLRALNELTAAGLSLMELAGLGASVGSDVPYCVLGGTALAEGEAHPPAASARLRPGGVQAALPHLHAGALPGHFGEKAPPPPGHGGSAGGPVQPGPDWRGPADVQCL